MYYEGILAGIFKLNEDGSIGELICSTDFGNIRDIEYYQGDFLIAHNDMGLYLLEGTAGVHYEKRLLSQEQVIAMGLQGHVSGVAVRDRTTPVSLDIKPGSCPNPLNVKSRGVLPVAILGTEDFDVTNIDALTVSLAGVAPIRSCIEDVSQPLNVEDCEDYGVDGYADLSLKFDIQKIVAALGADIEDGDVFELNLIGMLTDNTQIEGAGTVLILKKGKK